jgi:hypothetical protein
MQHVSAVEASLGKRHRKRAALMQGYALIEPNPLAQSVTRFDVFGGQVYAGDLAPVSVRDKACSAAETASNVENMHLSREPELIEKFLRRLTPANMKLVDRSKIIDRYGICGLAKRDDASAYRLDKTAVRVVPRYIGLHWHRAPHPGSSFAADCTIPARKNAGASQQNGSPNGGDGSKPVKLRTSRCFPVFSR